MSWCSGQLLKLRLCILQLAIGVLLGFLEDMDMLDDGLVLHGLQLTHFLLSQGKLVLEGTDFFVLARHKLLEAVALRSACLWLAQAVSRRFDSALSSVAT